MAHVQVKGHTLRAINEKIASERREKRLRPTATAIIECLATGNILMVESDSKLGHYWAFPQGGVEEDEGVIDALFREIREETEIPPESLTVRKFCLSDEVLIPNWRRKGYTEGKSLYYFHLTCERIPRVRLDGREAVRFGWFSRAEALYFARQLTAREDMRKKAEGMLLALQSAFSA